MVEKTIKKWSGSSVDFTLAQLEAERSHADTMQAAMSEIVTVMEKYKMQMSIVGDDEIFFQIGDESGLSFEPRAKTSMQEQIASEVNSIRWSAEHYIEKFHKEHGE